MARRACWVAGVMTALGCTPAEIVLVLRDAGVAPADDASGAADVAEVSDAGAAPDGGSARGAVPAGDVVAAADVVAPRDVPAAVDVPAAQRPARCADVRRADPSAADGEHTLYVQGDPRRPWRAWCRGMASTPAEYLPLMMRGGGQNASQYTAGGGRPGVDVRTVYARVRVDPTTLRVSLGDQTFATSTGRIATRDRVITAMPFGVAGDCIAGGSRAGVANIDLRGTPFAVAADAFALAGFMPGGAATYGAGGRVVDLRGGGYCGWIAPRDAPYDPVNDAGGFALPLTWIGP